ncbi:MAG: EFR1 family ferrodoxin [Treponema sp.]|nr:EFR1 family ferrodoxin [Treponema sp.]
MLYFSGTGNSKFIAELFSRNMNVKCHSIEEKLDFDKLIAAEEVLAFCYPVYGSMVPRIMREFVERYMASLENKKIIIFCTQLIFSGDGSRVFAGAFPRGFVEVVYAEHFFMPNNVYNVFLLPHETERKIKKYIKKAERKMELVCSKIRAGIIKKRGFNVVSRILGLSQRVFMPILERNARAMDSVKVNNDCVQCRLCVSICPMNNLEYQDGKIAHRSNCTICCRCVNSCPEKAITVLFHGKVKRQYRGLGKSEQV